MKINEKTEACIEAADEVEKGRITINEAARKYRISRGVIRIRLRRRGVPPLKPGRPSHKIKEGDRVSYHDFKEFGTVTGLNTRYVFVKFDGELHSTACKRTQLKKEN